MSDAIKVFLFGMLFGSLLTVMIVANAPASIMYKARKALDACQATLPREQYCKLSAKPITQ